MSLKLLLYCIFIPICMWIVTSTNLDRLFRKNKIKQIHLAYIALSLIFSYLITNFFMDIYNIFNI